MIFSFKSFSFIQVVDTSKINKTRLYIMSGSLVASLTGTYFYIENSWWSEQSKDFHFDKGNDTDEWALKHNYISLVPVQFDITAHNAIPYLNNWNYNV